MKLKDEIGKLPKDMVYDTYLSIVYKTKDYDNITRTKMIEEILNEYSRYDTYLYDICTYKELDFLDYSLNKKLSSEDIIKYEIEIKNLYEKCIFSWKEYTVIDEQKERVQQALDRYKKEKEKKKKESDVLALIIGLVKINGELLVKAYDSLISQITSIKEPVKLFGHPLIHYYCDFDYVPFHDTEEETIYYRLYWDDLEDIRNLRKDFGIAGTLKFNPEDYINTFYYGFPINQPSVKKMYNKLKGTVFMTLYEMLIDRARIYNDTAVLDKLIEDQELLELIHEALLDMPCTIYNGYTPRDYDKEKNKEEVLNSKLTIIPQNNANLPRKAADLYYKLYFALLEFVNKKTNIVPELKKIYKQEGLNVNELKKIDEYLWNHREYIDEFIAKNEYNFSLEELDIVKGFTTAVKSVFLVVGFEREYTMLLDFYNHKLYMVKGIRANLDEVIDPDEIPLFIDTTILMFNDKLIFNGFLSQAEIKMGNDLKEIAIEECHKAMKYYHL